jgi:hypothetical protein
MSQDTAFAGARGNATLGHFVTSDFSGRGGYNDNMHSFITAFAILLTILGVAAALATSEFSGSDSPGPHTWTYPLDSAMGDCPAMRNNFYFCPTHRTCDCLAGMVVQGEK